MAETINTGPLVSIGGLLKTATGTNEYSGPSMFYQGYIIPDARYAPFNKDSLSSGRFPGILAGTDSVLVDQIPSTNGTATVAALANTVTSTPMVLVSASPGGTKVTIGGVTGAASAQCVAVVPIIPFTVGSSFPVSGTPVNALALDFGFCVGTTSTGTPTTVTAVTDATRFNVGQWIVIGGAGNSGNTLPLVTQVTGITSTTLGNGTITISPGVSGSLVSAPIGWANFNGNFPAQGSATASQAYLGAGVVGCYDPCQALSRGLSVTCNNASGTGGNITVKGYDVYGMAMSETITIAPGTALTAYGKKAFKYVVSATPNFTDATYTYSVGVSDTFGLPLRADKWEYLDASWAAATMTANTGWTVPVQGTASATTGDVRGTIQVSAIGAGSGIGTNQSNNSRRFFAQMSIPLFNLTQATAGSAVSLFGSTQA